MKKMGIVLSLLCLASLLPAAWNATVSWDAERFWAQWRGPYGSGVAPFGDPPVEWGEGKNIKWKTEIPGKGSSSPIVWGDHVFVTSAVPTGEKVEPPKPPEQESEASSQSRRRRPAAPPTEIQDFAVLAIDRKSGKILWRNDLHKELPHEGTHPTGTWASNSPVTDGTHVYAFFGSRGLYCLDMKGNVVWKKNLGKMTIKLGFGEGSSPALAGDRLILNWDHEGQSFIIALDKKTGKELWKADRDEGTSWATPLVVEHKGKRQVVTSATRRVHSYDLETGELIWESEGMTANTIPSPVASDGMVYLTSGFRGNALLAVRLDSARGDITDKDSIVWKFDRDTPYVPSPLLYADTLYVLKSNSGILSCFNSSTGQVYYGQQRVDGVPNVYASPVGASNRVYITGREGTTVVIERGPEFKVLATNSLEDGFDASPAIVENELYLRGRKYLYCVAKN